jgi:hypothetical protein
MINQSQDLKLHNVNCLGKTLIGNLSIKGHHE